MAEIRKIITLREVVYSELGHKAARPVVRVWWSPDEPRADAHVERWPPAWAVSDRPAELWAATQDLAFPLARTDRPGRWLAVTCLPRRA